MKCTRLYSSYGLGLLMLFTIFIPVLVADSLTFLGSTGGMIRDIAVYEDVEAGKTYLYVAQGAAIIVYDVTDYQNPVEVNRFFTSPNEIYNLSISGDFLLSSCGVYSARIYSLQNPIEPMFKSTIGSFSHSAHLSGHLLYTSNHVISPTGGSTACYSRGFVYDINDLEMPILVNEFERCARDYFYSHFLFAADAKVSEPNIFWSYSRGPYYVIWNSPNGIGVPPYDSVNKHIFPPSMIQTGESPRVVAYQDKVILTKNDRIIAYDPFITDASTEINELYIDDIIGESLLDKDNLYVPTSTGYQVVELSNIDKPVLKEKYGDLSYEPKIILNGIAYGFNEFTVLINSFVIPDQEINIIPKEESSIKIINRRDWTLDLRSYPNRDDYIQPRDIYKADQELTIGLISIRLTDTYNRSFARSFNHKFLIVDDVSNPEYPIQIGSFYIGDSLKPNMTVVGDILSIPTSDSGTFHFLLDDVLFGTPVDGWLEYQSDSGLDGDKEEDKLCKIVM